MTINVRRVVTGHDDQGRAKVLIDETVKNVASQRPGALYSVIWSSEGFPVNNDGDADPSGKKIGTTISDGTVFRIVSFGPGVAPRNHRTDSIDYAVVMAYARWRRASWLRLVRYFAHRSADQYPRLGRNSRQFSVVVGGERYGAPPLPGDLAQAARAGREIRDVA